jgi:hypothetical protein
MGKLLKTTFYLVEEGRKTLTSDHFYPISFMQTHSDTSTSSIHSTNDSPTKQ